MTMLSAAFSTVFLAAFLASPRGLAAGDDDGGRGANAMTALSAADAARRGRLFFMVTQYPAGGLVDEVNSGTGRAGHGFIAIRTIGRRGIGHLNLNIHAGPRAAKYQFAHLSYWFGKSRLCIDLSQGRPASCRRASPQQDAQSAQSTWSTGSMDRGPARVARSAACRSAPARDRWPRYRPGTCPAWPGWFPSPHPGRGRSSRCAGIGC